MSADTRILWLPSSDYESRSAVFDYENNHFVGANKNYAGVRVDSTTALQSTVVLACVRVLAESIASLPLHIYQRREDGGKAIAREHPLYRVLHTCPNSWQTSFEWREQQLLHLGTYGQSFSEVVRDSRDIISELIPLHPSRMRVERMMTGELRYLYQEEAGGLTTYSQGQVMHIRWLSDDGVNGIVPIELARDAIGLARACEIHGASFFGNGARPGVVLATDNVLSAEAAENLRSNWERVHRGPDRASRTAVLQGGLKPMEIGSSNQESQFLETRRFQIEEICRLYRVPPHLVGDLTRSSFSNIEQQSIDFVQHTLVPWLRRLETAFARDLLFDSETYFVEFDTRGLLRGDAAARGSYYSTLYNLGVASINEIRSWENLDPVDGGDLRFVGLSMQTLGEANAKVKAASEAPPASQPTADISGLTQVMQQVAAGTVSPEAAMSMMKAVFPALPDAEAGKLLAGVKKTEEEVPAQPAEPEGPTEPQPTADVNGLLAVLGQVGAGAVTPEAALAIIRAVFPTMPEGLASAIVAGVQSQAPPPADPAAPAADAAPAEAPPQAEEIKKKVGNAGEESKQPPVETPSNAQSASAESRVFCSTGKGGGKDASCSPKGTGGGASIPDASDLTKVRSLGGSTGATLAQDKNGNSFVVKGGNSPDHIRSEAAANAVYEAAGVAVPRTKLDESNHSKPKQVSEYVEAKPLASVKGAERQQAISEIQKGFAADALLANWDVVGLEQDNILVPKSGPPMRVDNGGSLKFRAQGKDKPFGSTVGELDSLRTSQQGKPIFGSLKDDDIASQIGDLSARRDKILAATPEPLRSTMSQRLDYMEKWASGKSKRSLDGSPVESRVFCATGPGGGKDASCSPKDTGGSSSGKLSQVMRKDVTEGHYVSIQKKGANAVHKGTVVSAVHEEGRSTITYRDDAGKENTITIRDFATVMASSLKGSPPSDAPPKSVSSKPSKIKPSSDEPSEEGAKGAKTAKGAKGGPPVEPEPKNGVRHTEEEIKSHYSAIKSFAEKHGVEVLTKAPWRKVSVAAIQEVAEGLHALAKAGLAVPTSISLTTRLPSGSAMKKGLLGYFDPRQPGKVFVNATLEAKQQAIASVPGRFAGSGPGYTVVHEAAHMRHMELVGKSGFMSQFKQHTPAHRQIASEVSEYAMKNEMEFVAETASGHAFGKTYSATVYALYEHLGGPPLKGGKGKKSKKSK